MLTNYEFNTFKLLEVYCFLFICHFQRHIRIISLIWVFKLFSSVARYYVHKTIHILYKDWIITAEMGINYFGIDINLNKVQRNMKVIAYRISVAFASTDKRMLLLT